MLIVDASLIFEVVVGSDRAEPLRALLRADGEPAAPHLVDAEVLGVGSKHASAGACFALSGEM